MIKATNLTRRYGDFTAVDSVSFSIAKGEVVGLLGHNGAGKTTIMKMLTGYLEPSAGSVGIADLDIASERLTVQSKIGYLPEVAPLYPEMRVLEYLEYVSRLRNIPEQSRQQAIAEAISRTGLKEKALQDIATLSKGFKQRLGVAQAIIHSPEILILDEPTSGLDPSQIEEMRQLIRDLSSSCTILLSTHIMQEVEAMCDRVMIILNGRLEKDERMDSLRASNRIRLEVDQDEASVAGKLKALSGISSIECTRAKNGKGTADYILNLKDDGEALIPQIAKTVVDTGWNLHALEREQRNLETVFRELNSKN